MEKGKRWLRLYSWSARAALRIKEYVTWKGSAFTKNRKKRLCATDRSERYFDICHVTSKEALERHCFVEELKYMKNCKREHQEDEMTFCQKQSDNDYRPNHVVTATQKKILKVFGLTEKNIEYRVTGIKKEMVRTKMGVGVGIDVINRQVEEVQESVIKKNMMK